MLTARLPELLKTLRACSSELSGALGALPNSTREVDAALARSIVLIAATGKRLNGTAASSAKRLQKRISGGRKNPTVKDLWAIYSDLQAFVEDLNQQQKDSKWDKA
jgi:hypothetical protein